MYHFCKLVINIYQYQELESTVQSRIFIEKKKEKRRISEASPTELKSETKTIKKNKDAKTEDSHHPTEPAYGP